MTLDYNASIHDFTFVCFDLETTGLSAENNKIIEIGAVKCTTSEIIETYETFVDIQEDIPEAASEVNGITRDMITGQPLIRDCLQKLLPMIEGAILVAHNISFDFRFLNAELARNNFPMLQGIPMVDTVMLGRKALPALSSHKLNDLANYYGIDLGTHHRALDDALTCREILIKCSDELSILGELSISEILV